MSGCSGIKELSDSLGNLTNLQHLELSECSSIKEVPESLCGLTQLQYLNLSGCTHITRLPKATGSLVNLEFLNMSRCGVRELPESFKCLSNLLHLDLEYSPIEKGLAGALQGLTALQYLDMSETGPENNLEREEMPAAMKNLTNLKVLDLACSLHGYFDVENDGFLDFIGTLTNLEHLDLSRNELKYVPESIGNLKKLHTLNVKHCNELKSLPESIGGATGLKSVLLDGCSHELLDKASSLLHYSLSLPLFMVRADGVSGHSNLHLLEGENVGELQIVSLENVRSLEEARRLNLLTKQNLRSLKLVWTSGAVRLLEDIDLLGQLVPPMSLKNLFIEGYSTQIFPSWFMAISHHLPNLTTITLNDLPKCSNLPPLGQLRHLESLYLDSLPSLTEINRSICGGKGAFPRLAKLGLYRMQGLEEWNTTYTGEDGSVAEFMFPMLDELDLLHCPKLRLKPCPPKCREWTICNSEQVISSLEESDISSHRCNPTPTTSLAIWESQLDGWTLFHHFPALEELRFSFCPNVMIFPDGVKQLSSLKSLILWYCDNISALPEWLSDISSLEKLVITGCMSIKSLPLCIQQLTNLQNLRISDNEELQQWCESEENKAKLAHIKCKVSSPPNCFHIQIKFKFSLYKRLIINFLCARKSIIFVYG
jgi:Leucine-rich repeat (LRR) protein